MDMGVVVDVTVQHKCSEQPPPSPCVPIILCALLTYTALMEEQKWQMPQEAGKNGVYPIADAPASF